MVGVYLVLGIPDPDRSLIQALTPSQLFFDDEHRNFEVESLGATMQLVPSSGTDRRLWEQGLALWRKRRGIRITEPDGEFAPYILHIEVKRLMSSFRSV